MTNPDPSRAAFEQWYIEDAQSLNISLRDWTREELMRAYLERRQSGLYRSESANSEWKVWQAAMAHKGADRWQSIETAPRDGSEVWAFNGEQARMRWIEGPGYALWVWVDELLEDADPSPDQPTHWQLLPAAPKQEGST